MRKNKNDEKYFGIAIADLFAGLFSIMSLLFIIHAVLPIADQKPVNAEQTVGIICAELSWPGDRDVDLDEWGQSPTDTHAIGYSHSHGENLSLLRDVIGHANNPSKINQELICANAAADGEWIFNVHYFTNHAKDADSTDPIKDDKIEAVMVLSQNSHKDSHKWVARTILEHEGDEKTMFRFRIENGLVVPTSFNTITQGLRTGESK